MDRYNFLDPQQEYEYRAKAKAAGRPLSDTDLYVSQRKKEQQMAMESEYKAARLGLDLEEQQLKVASMKRDLMGTNSAPGLNLGKMTDGDTKMYNALSAAQAAKSLLEGGLDTGHLGNLATNVGAFFGKTGEYSDYKSKLALTTSALKSALIGSAQSDAEIKGLLDALPKSTDQEQVALQKLNNFIDLYGQKFGMTSQVAQEAEEPGLGLNLQADNSQEKQAVIAKMYGQKVPEGMGNLPPQQQGTKFDAPAGTAPAMNLKGEIAKYGDVVYNEQKGQLETYGKPPEKDLVFKKTKDGAEIDNSFISWLANNEFIPVAVSIIGGFLGGTASAAATMGVGTLAGGAMGSTAGFAAGKTFQQGLLELLDPDKQDLSDMAKAVVIESATDAIMNGAFFGMARGARGLKLLFSNGANVSAKAAATLAEESVEQVAKKSLKQKAAERMTETAYGFDKAAKESFEKAFGTSLGEETLGRYKSIKEAATNAPTDLRNALSALKEQLSGKSVSVKEVVSSLQDIQHKALSEGGNVIKGDMESGVGKLDDFIKELVDYGDEIPLEKLNDVKRRLQTIFPKSGADFSGVTKASKELVAEGATSVKNIIEKYAPEVAGTNKEVRILGLINDFAPDALKKMDENKLKWLLKWDDFVVGAVSPQALLAKKSFEFFKSRFDLVTQANILNNSLKTAAGQGSREGVRNVLRFATYLGIAYGADNVDLHEDKSQQIPATEAMPGLDVGMEQPMPEPIPTDGGGGRPGLDLGAYSYEGVPLYR